MVYPEGDHNFHCIRTHVVPMQSGAEETPLFMWEGRGGRLGCSQGMTCFSVQSTLECRTCQSMWGMLPGNYALWD